jgi:hypothetical protein
MALPILSGRGWKSWSTVSTSCSLTHVGIQTLAAIYAKTVEKNIGRPLQKNTILSVLYNFRIKSFAHF